MNHSLSARDALDLLVELTSPTSHPDTDTTLQEICQVIDLLPQTVRSVAHAINAHGLEQVRVRLKHDLLGDVLDPADYGFDWEGFDPVMRDVLCAASVCVGGCDEAALRGVSGQEEVVSCMTRMREMGLIEEVDHTHFVMRWSARMLVWRHVGDLVAWRRRHASYFLERLPEDTGDLLPMEDANLDGVFEFGIQHEPDLAARALLLITMARRNSSSPESLLHMYELVLSRRPCVPGDLLSIELLGRQGELLRFYQRVEQSVEVLQLAITLDPPRDQSLYGGMHMALALSLSLSSRFEEALHHAHVAIESYASLELEPHWRDAMSTVANILIRKEDYEGALEVYTQLGQEVDLNNRGALAIVMGDAALARKMFEQALARAERANHHRLALLACNHLMYVDLLDEDRDTARARCAQIVTLCEHLGSRLAYRPMSQVARALYALRYGSLLEAHHLASDAFEIDSTRFIALAMRAALAALLNNMEDARHDLERLRAHPTTSKHLEAHVRHVSLAIAYNEAIRAGDLHGDQIDALLDALDAPWIAGETCAIQLLFMDLRQRAASLRAPEFTLWLDERLQFARRGDQPESLDLRKSTIARVLLDTLLAHHRAQPGQICSTEALFEAAWPGQVWNESARTRFHTAIHRLRDRLLGDLLLTHNEEGYSLVTRCRIATM